MPQYSSPVTVTLPPLGIACLAAYLKRHGIKVECTDFRLLSGNAVVFYPEDYPGRTTDIPEISFLPLILSLFKNYKEGRPLLHGFESVILEYIRRYKSLNYFDFKAWLDETYNVVALRVKALAGEEIIGFTTVSSNLLLTVMLSLMLRREKRNIKIIYGGPQVTLSASFSRLVLKLGIADAVIPGEGEDELLEIIRAYAQNKPPGKKYRVESPAVFPDLDALPDPDFSVFPLEKYSPLTLPLYASRGCLFNCRFCNYSKLSPYRSRSPVKVVDTMENLHKKYDTVRFHFSDSALNTEPDWLEGFTEELIKRGCGFQWGGFFKPWLDNKLLGKLKQSGLYQVNLGVDSFSDKVLRRMGKANTASKEILKTIELFCSSGILVCAGIIVGFPGETRSDFLFTWEQLFKLKKKYRDYFLINPQAFQLRPPSECYEKYTDYGLKLKKWDKKVTRILPEVGGIVKNIPMSFSGYNPPNEEVAGRLEMIKNINQPFRIKMNENNRRFLKEFLKYIGESSTVKVSGEDFKIYDAKLKAGQKGYFFVADSSGRKILLTEKELFVFQHLNGGVTLSGIAGRLSSGYKLKKNRARAAILKFLNYLVDNDIYLEIKR